MTAHDRCTIPPSSKGIRLKNLGKVTEPMDQGSAAGSPQGAPIRCIGLKVQLHFLLSHVGDLQAGTADRAQLLVLSYGLPRLSLQD